MSRTFEVGQQALYNYQRIKYFPFDVNPGSSYVLTSDPWAYLKAWLDQKTKKSRGDNKLRLERARYFVEQAESFQTAADKTQLPTKATMTYYSLLNLIKAFLSVNGVDLEKREELHGLQLTENDYELKVGGRVKNYTNIFLEFCNCLGKPIKGQHTVTIQEVLHDLTEVHELGFTLGIIKKRKFLPIRIEFLTNQDCDKLFTEVHFSKEHDTRLPMDKFFKGKRATYFKLRENNENGYVIYRSKRRRSYTKSNLPAIYKNICKEYKDFDIHLLLTRDGYKYYVNLIPNDYHRLANILLTVFYIGTAARYRPTITKEIMSGELYPIIAEVVETSPKQFLYQITNLITSSVCAVPQAKI
jgi:hypothetical protein